MTADDFARLRETAARFGADVSSVTDDELRGFMQARGERFRDAAPTTAEQAATIILDGVRSGRWWILVGPDAEVLDRLVRQDPERAYEPEFFQEMIGAGGMNLGV